MYELFVYKKGWTFHKTYNNVREMVHDANYFGKEGFSVKIHGPFKGEK